MRSPFGRHNMNFSDTIFYQSTCEFEVSHLLHLYYWGSHEMELYNALAVSAQYENVTTTNLAIRSKLLAFSGGGIPQAAPLMYNWLPPADMKNVLASPCPMHNVTAAQKFLLKETLEQCVPPGSKKERALYFGYLEGMIGSTGNHTIVESCSRYKKWIAEAHVIFNSTIATNPDPKKRVFRFNFALGSLLGSHLSTLKAKPLCMQEVFKHFALSMVICVLIGKMSSSSGGISSATKVKNELNAQYYFDIMHAMPAFELQHHTRLAELSESFGEAGGGKIFAEYSKKVCCIIYFPSSFPCFH